MMCGFQQGFPKQSIYVSIIYIVYNHFDFYFKNKIYGAFDVLLCHTINFMY